MGRSCALTAWQHMIDSVSEGGSMTLSGFFAENSRVAIAFSGGVDSSYLLYEAVKAGVDACASFVLLHEVCVRKIWDF